MSGMPIGDAVDRLMRDGMPVRFTAYDGSSAGPPDAAIGLHLRTERGLAHLMTAPGDLGLARAYVGGDLDVTGVHPGDPYDLLVLLKDHTRFRVPPPTEVVAIARGLGLSHLRPPAPPPQEHLPRWRRAVEGLRHSMSRDAEVIARHYDVSNRFYERVLGPSMAYTCAVYPGPTAPSRRPRRRSSTWSAASSASGRASGCWTSAAGGAAWCGTPRASTGCGRSG